MPKIKSTVKLAPRNCLEDEDERPVRREHCPSGTKGRPSCHRPTVMVHQVAAEGRIQCSDPSCLRTFSTMKHMKRHLKDRHSMAYDRLQRCWRKDTPRHVLERKRGMADDRTAQRHGLTSRTAQRNIGLRADAPCPRSRRHPSTHATHHDNLTSQTLPSTRDVRWLPTAPDNPLQPELDDRNKLSSTVRKCTVSETVTHANFGELPKYFSRSTNTLQTIHEDKSNQTCLAPTMAAVPKPDIYVIHGDDGTITISDEGIIRDETVSTMIKVLQDNPEHNIPQNIRMFIRKLPPRTILNAVHQRDLVVGFRLLRAGLTTKFNPKSPFPSLQTMLPSSVADQRQGTLNTPETLVLPLSPLGACVEPGVEVTETETEINAPLPSDEACGMVSGAGEPSTDAHNNTTLEINAPLPSDEACGSVGPAGEPGADTHNTSFTFSLPSLPSVEACGGDTTSQLLTPSLTPLGAWDALRALDEEHSSTSTEDFEIIEIPTLDDMDVE